MVWGIISMETYMDQDKKQNDEVRDLAIIPRGARWVCAGWDWTEAELHPRRREALDGLFRLRVIEPGRATDSPGRTLVLHERASSWFVPLTSDGVALEIEFGYLTNTVPHKWVCMSRGGWPSAGSRLTSGTFPKAGQTYGSFPFNHFESWDEAGQSKVSGVSSHNGRPREKTRPGTFYSGTHVRDQAGAASDSEKPLRSQNIQVVHSDHHDIGQRMGRIEETTSAVLNFTMGQVIHGRVEDGARVFLNGNKVPVRNGFFNLRVDHPTDVFNHEIEVAIVSADGRRRLVRRYAIHVNLIEETIESINLPLST